MNIMKLTQEEKGSRLQCLLMGSNFIIQRRPLHFVDRIVDPIYKRRDQNRRKEIKIDSINELE